MSEEAAGFLDLHIHGAFGIDVLTAVPAELDRLAFGLESRGVDAFLPTLVPVPLPALHDTVARLSGWMASRKVGDGRGARPLGLHFEGPFVSPARAGALHRSCLLDGADERKVAAFFAAVGTPPGRPMVTLAPEIPGGPDLIREFTRRDFVVAIGHTEADVAALEQAAALGARHMTHFGNAMKPLHHREAGPVGWGLVADAVTVDVIADLRHLSPEMLRLVFRAKGADRVALISDAVPAAGGPDGDYSVWGERLTLKEGCVRNAAGHLAGSGVLLDECAERLASLGISPADVRRSSAEVPRRILGLA